MKMSFFRAAGFAAVSVLSIASAMAADNLENLLPKNTALLVSFDVQRFMKLPLIESMKKTDPEFQSGWTEMEQKLAAQNIKMDDVASSAVVFALEDGASGMLVRTAVPEDKFEALLKSEAFGKPPYKVEQSGSKRLFVFSAPENSAASLPGLDVIQANPLLNKYAKGNTVLSYVKPGTVLISDYENAKNLITLMGASLGPKDSLLSRKSSLGQNPVAWLVFDKAQKAEANKNAPVMSPMASISGGALALDFTGKDSEDCALNALVDFKDAQSASMLSMQAQGLMMMLSGSAFQGDPQLGMDLVSAIKIQNQDKQVKVSLLLSKDLQTRLKDYTEKSAAMEASPALGGAVPGSDFNADTKPRKAMKKPAPEDSLTKEAPLAK